MTVSAPTIDRLFVLHPDADARPGEAPDWIHTSLAEELPIERVSSLDELGCRLETNAEKCHPTEDEKRVVAFRTEDFDAPETTVVEEIEEFARNHPSCVGIGLADIETLSDERSEPEPRVYLFSRSSIHRIVPLLVELVLSDVDRSVESASASVLEDDFPKVDSVGEIGDDEETDEPTLNRPNSEVQIEQTVARAEDESDTATLVGEPLECMTSDSEPGNRTPFKSFVAAELAEDTPFAVFVLQFRRLHHAGARFGSNTALGLRKKIQARLLDTLRTSDVVTHLDTSTYAILCPEIERETDAETVGERITETISQPYTHEDQIVMLRPTLGYALNTEHDRSPADIIHKAIRASSFARGASDPSLNSPRSSRWESSTTLELAEQLKRGIDQEQFELHFQPIVSIERGEIVGFEGLCRWNHPESGMISPGRFIPVAEKTGLIFELDQWVLEQGLREVASWTRDSETPPFLALNVSRPTMSRAEFSRGLDSIGAEDDSIWERIVIELTESAVLQHHDIARDNLEFLRSLGAAIALDDFGAGYSSFSALKNLPIDIIKIDRSFISEISDSRQTVTPLIEAISDTSNALGLDLVAEGIETEQEFEFFENIGCKYAQGFFFAKSRPSEDLDSLYTETRVAP